MRYLSLAEVLELHRRIALLAGGPTIVRDFGAVESAVAQPRATFAGEDLYPDLATKATALAFSLISNHPFVDGNKRVGHAALETFLIVNGFELSASVEAGERMILDVGDYTVLRTSDLSARKLLTPFLFSRQRSGFVEWYGVSAYSLDDARAAASVRV